MAEQEPTAEQLAQIAAENEEDEHSVNYKPPAQKSIQEIQELDKDDESLRKYKEALLGRVAVSAGRWVGIRMSPDPVTTPFPVVLPPFRELKNLRNGALTLDSYSPDPNVPNVIVTRLTLVCSSSPGPLELDLTGEWVLESLGGAAGIQSLPLKIIFCTGALWWDRGEVQLGALQGSALCQGRGCGK